MPVGRSRKYVHLYARQVPRVGLIARRSYATWRSSGAGDTRERWYCFATRRVRFGPIRAFASFSSDKCCVLWRARRTPRGAAVNMIYVGNCRSQPFTHDSGTR